MQSRRPELLRGTLAYTQGGAQVDVVEVVGQRVLVRQAAGCVERTAAGWVDHSRLHWMEAYELYDHEEEQPPRAWYSDRIAR